MAQINIKLDGKPVTKLINEVSKGIGTMYKPRAIRKEADAKAYELEVLAKAEAKKKLIESNTNDEIVERAKQRLYHQEINRQKNIEDIAEKSIGYLGEGVSDKPLENDWRTQFFNKAQDISSEDIQDIWAKILAEEVTSPGTISIRTLEIISNLSKIEAEKFQIACSLASGYELIYKFGDVNHLNDFSLTFNDILLLKDAGLIHQSDNLVRIHELIQPPGFKYKIFIHLIGNKMYQFAYGTNPPVSEIRLHHYAFTTAGKELCRILQVPIDQKYCQKLVKHRSDMGFGVSEVSVQIPNK